MDIDLLLVPYDTALRGWRMVTAYAPEYDTDGRIEQAALRIIETLLAVAGGT